MTTMGAAFATVSVAALVVTLTIILIRTTIDRRK